ncbi:EAL domain-containing protein [uncultured Xylophilus sp.]|uniref:sensor domain-containing phosphodiesterase n=1 Tax=uncultured Xylophilus sp. TaxID=296832 RepID=UPI0025D726EB|nr:EAL domain-containing protein [uncultured Xylophilus sp.]
MPSSLVQRLTHAVAHHAIYPVFQPIVCLGSGTVSGFEVLARWHDSEAGDISPVEFIPVARDAGLLPELTAQLVARACREAADWPGRPSLSLNIVPELLQDDGLPAMILDAARDAGIDPTRLCIEITEQALEPSQLERARRTVNVLKSHGVKVGLDDFGTGHSSLTRLQDLPFDTLKIDMSFVQSMLARRESRKIVAAVVGLGQSLGLSVVAEGVESLEQVALLQELGCCLGQGFHFGLGMQADEARALLLVRALPDGSARPRPLDRSPNQRLAQLQAIYDSSVAAIAFIDHQHRIVSANAPFAELCYTAASSLQGRCVHEVMPFLTAAQCQALDQALRGEPIPEGELWLQDRCYLVSCRTVRDEARDIMGVSVAMVDITRRKAMERALRDSEEHYRNTVELSPQSSWVAQPNGHFLFISPKYQIAVGRSLEELQGSGWAEVLHPDYRLDAFAAWTHSLETGEIHDMELPVWYVRAQEYRWTRCYAAPCRALDGTIVRWYGTVEDIHARKLAENLLRSVRQPGTGAVLLHGTADCAIV